MDLEVSRLRFLVVRVKVNGQIETVLGSEVTIFSFFTLIQFDRLMPEVAGCRQSEMVRILRLSNFVRYGPVCFS